MRMSVVIPTLDEGEHIGACLRALAAGTRVPDEVIVADGGSSDDTRRIARSLGAVVVPNEARDAASGRNVGIAASTGDVVAFTDGDCVPGVAWLASLERDFCERPCDGVGGRVVAAPPANAVEAFWCRLQLETVMAFGEEPFWVRERDLRHSFITANCAYSRYLLDALGGFDEWFANNGEDVDLFWRAIGAGARLYYEPAAVVSYHGVTSVSEVRRKSMRNGVSSSKLQKRYGGLVNHDGNVYRVWWNAVLGMARGSHEARLAFEETSWHLLGKYRGSIEAHVINV